MRFPEFTDEWVETQLGKCVKSFEYGMNAAATEFDGTNKYIRITDINEATSKYNLVNPVSPAGILTDKYLVKENDILFTRTGASTGKTYIYDKTDGKLYFAGFLIRGRIDKHVNAKFVFHQTQSQKYDKWVKLMSARSGQPGINSREYSSYTFFMPKAIAEQAKIATLLSLIDQRIETQNKIIENLESLIKGILDNIVDVSDKHYIFQNLYLKAGEGGTPATSNTTFYTEGNIPFIKIDDLNHKYISSHQYYINENGLKNSSTWLVPINSILFSNGATIGQVSINSYPVCTKQGILGIIPSSLTTTEYLYYYMKSKYFRKQVCRMTVKGTMECAYLKDLNTIICYLPSNERQQNIVTKLKKLDDFCQIEKTILELNKKQKQYLLKNVFI